MSRMIRLLDGPAAIEAEARRAPALVRAVVDADGRIDVLDLLFDEPRPTERVFVYRAVPGASGDYRWMPEVDGEGLRATKDWRAWVASQG
jgi:hypothetical protein